MTKNIKNIFKVVLIFALIVIVVFVFRSVPIITGYGAKILCSEVFIGGRASSEVISNDLGSFPSNLGSYYINLSDSSASASLWGFAKKEAIFRKGFGCTLVNGTTKETLRQQHADTELFPLINQDTILWPAGNKSALLVHTGIDTALLHDVTEGAFDNTRSKTITGTTALVVVYNGKIIAERYASGYSMKTRLHGWSLTKSVTNALLGVLAMQGKLAPDEPAPIPQWKGDRRRQITIRHLTQMTSGLEWSEFGYGPSDFTTMLFKEKSAAEYAIKRPLKEDPGIAFNYSSGSANILSAIIRHKLAPRDYYGFPYRHLFHKIGMYSAEMDVDAGGTFVGSNYCYATARDWARFGLLFFNDGMWQGERILPEAWIKFTITPSQAKTHSERGDYGALWWIYNKDNIETPKKKGFYIPKDCFSCQGHGGQYIWVVPSRKLVVVRLSKVNANNFDGEQWLSDLISVLKITPLKQ